MASSAQYTIHKEGKKMATEITSPIILDSTGQDIHAQLIKQNALLQVIADTNLAPTITNYKMLRDLVSSGVAQQLLSIGDQVNVEYTYGGTTYTVPLDIVHFGNVELRDGETVPGMYLQWHYATPLDIQFSNSQALWYAETELAAGTYNLTVPANWGNCIKDNNYQFTLTQAVPAGGQLRGFSRMPDAAATSWTVASYATPAATAPIETVSVTLGSEGTALGTWLDQKANGNLNGMRQTAYGYNRWSQSAHRQWLNSKAAAGAWWTPQSNFDTPPLQAASAAGFMSCLSDDFLAVIQPIKIKTNTNNVSEADAVDETFDTFFLPSLEEMYGTPQITTEGPYWEYWKKALGLTKPAEYYPTLYPEYKTYAINAKTSAQFLRLRSATRGYSYYTWCVDSAGSLIYGRNAYYSFRCAPACVIC